jgi:hypothetical protein
MTASGFGIVLPEAASLRERVADAQVASGYFNCLGAVHMRASFQSKPKPGAWLGHNRAPLPAAGTSND